MASTHDYHDDWNEDYAEDDDPIKRLVTSREPRLDSAQQFGLFVALILDECEAGAASSWMGGVIDRLKLGGQVQTSRRPYRAPSSPATYHIGWIRRVIERARHNMEGDLGHRKAEAKDVMRVWIAKDVARRTQRAIAEYYDVAPSTIHDRVIIGRDAIYDALVADGRAEPATW